MNTNIPIITCNKNDAFTVNESSTGNGKLTYPIGLITSDEMTMAGGKGGTQNSTYYLYTNKIYWSASPNRVQSSSARVWLVDSTGELEVTYVYSSKGVRGVISLKYGTRISSGTGTIADPFIIE